MIKEELELILKGKVLSKAERKTVLKMEKRRRTLEREGAKQEAFELERDIKRIIYRPRVESFKGEFFEFLY